MRRINLLYGELDVNALSALMKHIEHKYREGGGDSSPELFVDICERMHNEGRDYESIYYTDMAEYVIEHQEEYISLLNDLIERNFMAENELYKLWLTLSDEDKITIWNYSCDYRGELQYGIYTFDNLKHDEKAGNFVWFDDDDTFYTFSDYHEGYVTLPYEAIKQYIDEGLILDYLKEFPEEIQSFIKN